MPFSTTALNQSLNAVTGGTFTSLAAYASLHSSYSGTGASELSGGSYAREAVTWNSAAGGTKTSASVAGTYSIYAGGTVAFIGLWSASSGGSFGGMGPNGGGSQYGFTSTAAAPVVFTAPFSAFTNGQTVVLFDSAGATISPDFTVGTVYYVLNASGATFQLSATSGGAAVNSVTVGAGIVQAINVEAFGSAGTFTLSSATLSEI